MTANLPTSFLEWRDEWTMEVGFMDEDHRHLAALLNRLARDHGIRAAAPGQPVVLPNPGALPLLQGLEELMRETRQHFQREEEIMRTDAYPDFDDHKADHDLLLAELSVLTRELQDEEIEQLTEPMLDALKDWLLSHVLDFDRKLAEFLKDPNQRERTPIDCD